jgi:hypothetical protein
MADGDEGMQWCVISHPARPLVDSLFSGKMTDAPGTSLLSTHPLLPSQAASSRHSMAVNAMTPPALLDGFRQVST